MKKMFSSFKRICALLIVFGLVTGLVPVTALEGFGALVAYAQEPAQEYELNNGYIKATVSQKTGGFKISTVDGDKINKSDNDRYLVFQLDEDNTSFTSFQVTRNGKTKEYIFGGDYFGSSDVTVTQSGEELIATWSVDELTFTQTISLVNTGSTEHGATLISYDVENSGAPAQIKARILMDTALGYQDYAYYSVDGDYVTKETTLGADGYSKSFYAVNNTSDPGIVAYTINASIDNTECKPYQTVFAHWNNLASTVFDYTPDETMTFTNSSNLQYLTSDSAYALYFDLGEVAEGGSGSAATHYGVYSNESVKANSTVAVNLNAPDVLQYAKNADGSENQSAYENSGAFSVKTYIENISNKNYSKVRVMVYAAGGIDPLDQTGAPTNSTYDDPYYMELNDFTAGESMEIDWRFLAEPQEVGQYAKVHYKVYDVSDDATQGSGQIMQQNLLGEGYSYILCPGSVEKIPKIRFTGSSPENLFSSGRRTLNVLGENFSMLTDMSAFRLMLSRVDGNQIGGQDSVQIPTSQIQIDDSTNVMTVIFSEDAPGTLVDGMYQLTVDYNDTSKQDISGQALRFFVSSDVQYKNDAYGYLAVVESESHSYSIRRFNTEKDYWSELDQGRLDRSAVLLEFQGSFLREESEDGSVVYSGISLNASDNVMTINGALDVKNGTVTVTEKNGSVTVDFDADIYTTGSGTSVWSGMAALTELEKGTNYDLIPYDEDGNRLDVEGETITLLWPSVGQGFQSLMGLLFELKYGELGTIAHEGATTAQGSETRVVAFGAAMDLSFLIPSSLPGGQIIMGRTRSTKSILGSSWDAAEHNAIQWTPAEVRALNKQANYRADTAKTDATAEDVSSGRLSDMTVDETSGYNSASIVIDDVLFGGEYLGVNMSVGLGIPPYIQGMPALEVLLEVHTVGDWSFGVDGQCHFGKFNMQASIEIMSKDDIPIPNKLTFFLGGITPGINVDGVGVLWLQGGGGGIDNLYETVFMTESIPPLKLILQAQFSVLQVFNATATLGLSLRGIDATLTNGQYTEYVNEESGVVTVPPPVTMSAGFRLDWYPEFYLQGAVNLNLAKIIQGGGYVVADATGFYEFFVRAAISIPTDVPIVGGISLAEVGMGVNDVKVWGQAECIGLTFGVTYFWGGDIDWDSGGTVQPTYPELVGLDPDYSGAAVALLEDEQTSQVLYMSLGNLRSTASTMPVFLAAPEINDELTSDVLTGSVHTMKLVQNGSGKLLLIQWDAQDEQTARTQAAGIVVANQTDSAKQYEIRMSDNSKGADDPANANANANFSFDSEEGTAYLAISFTDSSVYDNSWTITTPEGALLVIYDVAPLPEITAESAAVNGSTVTVELSGTQLESFTKLTVFAEGKNSGENYLLGIAEDPFAQGETTLALTLPEQMVSDTYSLRITAEDDGATCYSETEAEITYTNENQPSKPTVVSTASAGDYKVAVELDTTETIDGYQFTVKDSKGDSVSGASEVLLYLDGSSVVYNEDGSIAEPESTEAADSYIIGGAYSYTDDNGETVKTGLTAGDYTLEIRAWTLTASGAVLVSEPTTANVSVPEPVQTEIQVTATATNGVAQLMAVTRGDGETSQRMSLGSSDVYVQLTSDAEKFTGTWRLDGGYLDGSVGEITEATKKANITLTGLKDGTHMLNFVGKNDHGDAVSASYQFTVDTQGPRLLLGAPVNGSLFDYWTGELIISGDTDPGSCLRVVDNTTGETVYETADVTVAEDGCFTASITLDNSVLSHELTITVLDALGNESSKNVSVMSNGLGSIEKLLLYSGNKDVTNTELTAGGTYPLTLMAKLRRPDGAAAQDEDLYIQINAPGMVDWEQTVAEGDAQIQENASGIVLTTSSDAEGMITARFLVSDQGAYPVSAAFGFTGQQITSLDSDYTQIVTTDQLYTGNARTTEIEVWYRGTKLTEGTDYTIGNYSNNIEVTTETSKAQVEITGIGAYADTVIGQFEISYLELDESWITVSGVEGDNSFYVSDVSILPASGYEFVVDGETAQITMTADGEHTKTFRVRRISDGAMTDLVTREVSIDKTAPTGTITLDKTAWSKFLQTISFGLYKVNSFAATVTADDANGVSKTEYVICNSAYASVTELEAAGLGWSAYSDAVKPTIKENEDQIIYVRITDMAGNVSYISSDGLHVDTLAPEVSVAVTSVTNSGLTFTVTSSEAGKYYYAVQKAVDPAPTAEELKQGTGGVISAQQAGKPITLSVSGLDSNTAYVVYVVAEDTVIMLSDGSAAANVSKVVASDPAATARYDLADAQVSVDDAMYTGTERKPAVQVRYDGVPLTEGVDYEVTYHENVEASDDKPYVEVTGLGDYVGTATKSFKIKYLEMAEPYYTVSGTEGDNGYYVSDVTVAAKTGYELVAVDDSLLTFSQDGSYETRFRVRRTSDGAMTDVVTLQIHVDQTAPTGTVAVDSNIWTELLNTITFGLFFNETKQAQITADDASSGVASISYVVSDQALDLNELTAQTWSAYTGPVAMDADGNYVVYAKLTDKAGNVAYLGSDGLVIDTLAPGVHGIVDGGVYATTAGFTVDSDTVSVSVDGKTVDHSGTITLTASEAPQKIVVTDRAGNETVLTVTVYPPRVVTFVADGKSVSSAEVEYGADLAADQFPEIPAKTGYDQTAPKWDSDGLTDVKENITVTAIYTPNVYKVTAPETQTGYTVKLDDTTVTHGGSIGFTVEIAEGYNADDLVVTVNGEEVKAVDGVYTVEDVTGDVVIEVTGVKDIEAPKATVSVGTNAWKEFLNTISFGLFFNETQQAAITATDEGSGVYAVYYLISDGPVAIDDLEKSAWTPYTGPVSMAAEGNYVVYAKVVDNAGNVCYVNSNGLVIDTTAPGVNGIEDGGKYTGEVVFKVSDANIDTVTVNGEAVTGDVFTLKPAEGQQKIVVTDKAGNETVLTVTVSEVPEEPKDEICDGIHDCPSLAFSDLDTTAWYHLHTDYVIENGLMQGYPDKTFRPNATLSRAMVVQVLYNLEGRPAVSGADSYTDTDDTAWYSNAIVWATQNGIVNGYGQGLFGPEDPVTREQMAAIFYRYSDVKDYSLTEGNYDHFSDQDTVSAYARQAMRWAVGNGLLVGMNDGTLCPKCNTTRAEFAAVIQRFIETIAK